MCIFSMNCTRTNKFSQYIYTEMLQLVLLPRSDNTPVFSHPSASHPDTKGNLWHLEEKQQDLMYSAEEEVRVKRRVTNTTFTEKASFFYETKCYLSFPDPDHKLLMPKSGAKGPYLRWRHTHKKILFSHAYKQESSLSPSAFMFCLEPSSNISGASSHLHVPGFFVPPVPPLCGIPGGVNTWSKREWNTWLKATC